MNKGMNTARCLATAGLFSIAILLQGCATFAKQDRAAQSEAPLVLSGAEMAVELAPILLAVRNIYPAGTVIHNGGVIHLVGEDRLADVAGNAETQTLRHSVDEPGMRVIMTIAEGHYSIVARRSAGINSVADLKGKRVVAYPYTSSGYFLHKMLAREGLTEADVILVEDYKLDFIAPAIARREVDAVAVWEPDSINSLRVLGDDAIVFSGEGIFHELYNFNTTVEALEDPKKRREVVKLVRAIIDATEQINTNPAVAAEAQAMVSKSGGLYTVEEVADSWPQVKFVGSFAENMLDAFVKEEVWLAGQMNREPRSREELAKLIDRSIYEEALALAQ